MTFAFPIFCRSKAYIALMVIAMLLLGACTDSGDETITIAVIDSSGDPQAIGRRVLSPSAAVIRGSIAQGLVRYDKEGRIVPGLAERWIVTDDGLSFIFRLKNTNWADGSAITSEDVVRGLKERLEIETDTRLSRDLAIIEELRAMTGRVIEFRLRSPLPNFLDLLAQPEMGVRVDGQGTGPMGLDAGDDNSLQLAPLFTEERSAGVEALPDYAPLFLTAESASRAIARYQMGDVDIILGGRFHDLPLINVSRINPNIIEFDPVSGLFGLLFVELEGFLSEASNREALAMAIDRSDLLTGLNIDPWPFTTRLIPENSWGGQSPFPERWQDDDMAERRATARLRIKTWEDNEGEAPVLRIAMPDGPGADYVFGRIRYDWGLIGVEVQQVNYSEDADIRLIDEVAATSSGLWYLNQLACARRYICDEEGDFLLADATRAADPDVRRQQLAAAELSITRFNLFIPLGTPIRWSVIRPGIDGFEANPTGHHPLLPIALAPR